MNPFARFLLCYDRTREGQVSSIEKQSAHEIVIGSVNQLKMCGVETAGHLATGDAFDRVSQIARQRYVNLSRTL